MRVKSVDIFAGSHLVGSKMSLQAGKGTTIEEDDESHAILVHSAKTNRFVKIPYQNCKAWELYAEDFPVYNDPFPTPETINDPEIKSLKRGRKPKDKE